MSSHNDSFVASGSSPTGKPTLLPHCPKTGKKNFLNEAEATAFEKRNHEQYGSTRQFAYNQMTTAPTVEPTPMVLPRASSRPSAVPSWCRSELCVGALVYHPQHRVGVIQIVDGPMRFVAFAAADDQWVRSSELIEERYFRELLEARSKQKLDRSEPARSIPDELKNGYPMHPGFHTQIWPRIFSWVHSQAQPTQKDPNYKYWKQVLKTCPAPYTGDAVESKGDASDAYSGVSLGMLAKTVERYHPEEQMLLPTASSNIVKERETLFLYRYFQAPLMLSGFKNLKCRYQPLVPPVRHLSSEETARYESIRCSSYFYFPSRMERSQLAKLEPLAGEDKVERIFRKIEDLDKTVCDATPWWIRWYGPTARLIYPIYGARNRGNKYSDYVYPDNYSYEPKITEQEVDETWKRVAESYRQRNLTKLPDEIGWIFYPDPDGCWSQRFETVRQTTISEPTIEQQLAQLEKAEAIVNREKPELELIREVIEGKKTQEEAAAQLRISPGAYRALQSRVLNSNDPWDLVVTGDESEGIYAITQSPRTPTRSYRICDAIASDEEIVAGFHRVVNEILNQRFKNKSRTKSFVCTCGALKDGRPASRYFRDGRKRYRFDRLHSDDCPYDFQLYDAAWEIRASLLRHAWRTLPNGDHTAAEYARSKASSITLL